MKRLGLVITLLIIVLGLCAYGAVYIDIPKTTLQIAKDANSMYSYYTQPNSKTVRVGIGTNNFGTYDWTNAQIYGTGEFEVYNKNTYIATYDHDNCINISMVGKIFVLTDFEGNVIEKVSGPIKFKTEFGYLGIKDLKRAGKDAIYRGEIELVPSSNLGKFHIVNVVMLEDYLKGVVPNEMPVHFGLEALKAQSVSARNYVLSPRIKANPNYDVVDSVASQVYFGINTEKELSTQAVNETFGIVALYDWNLILAQYSSTAGGYSENYENAFSEPNTKAFPANPKPFLKGVPDYPEFKPLNKEEDAKNFYKSKPKTFDVKSPYYRWTKEWNREEIQDAIQTNLANQSLTGFVSPAFNKGEKLGIVKELKVMKRGVSGKIMELDIITENNIFTVQKELVIRRLLTKDGKALPSANVVFEHEYNDKGELVSIKAYGGGYGHGVGLSQYGAGFMATELKKSFDEILKHYYTNIKLGTVPVILSSHPSQNKVTQSFYTSDAKAKIVVDNKFKLKSLDVCINGTDESFNFMNITRYEQFDISKYLKKGLNTVTFTFPNSVSKDKGLRLYIEIAGKNGN